MEDKVLTKQEKKELLYYVDNFLYKVEDNFWGKISSIPKLRVAVDALNALYDELGGERT